MRRFQTLLALAGLCAARQPGFSIHHDLLAYPQFEVIFSDAYISEPEAKALLSASDPAQSTHEPESINGKEVASNIQSPTPGQDGNGNGDSHGAETYEIMNMHPHKYLCAIPVIEAPPAPNKTATEIAKAEEARELERASAHGLELVNALDGTCLYYVSGWWSYSFCYGHDVVQFHALPSKGGAPVKDPHSQEYILGRVEDPSGTSPTPRQGRAGKVTPPPADGTKAPEPLNTELQVKGDQRYLVQRMEYGTICDLTNRPRTIEIQYHCSPGSTQDRIGWIKEVTTCAYLMLVNTPRLCTDVAFQPPPQTRANVISCRTIVPEAEQASWHAQKTLEAKAAMVGQQRKEAQAPVTIGGVVVGGRQILGTGEDGKEPTQLKPPRSFAKDTIVEIVAMGSSKADGSKLEALSDEELEKLEISPELIEELTRQLQDYAGDKAWKLEVVEAPGDTREIRGIVDGEEDDDEEAAEGERKAKVNAKARAKEKAEKAEKAKDKPKDKAKDKPKEDKTKAKDKAKDKPKNKDKEEEKGSEEKFFKEEL
jgi:protein OS-9